MPFVQGLNIAMLMSTLAVLILIEENCLKGTIYNIEIILIQFHLGQECHYRRNTALFTVTYCF